MNSSAVTVHAERLSKAYGCTRVLHEVQLEMHPSSCVLIQGDNGSGKTTLLRCLAGLTAPTTGTVCWPAFQSTERRRVARHLGFLPHDPSFYSNLSVREHLLFAARMHDLANAARQVEEILERADLESFGTALPRQLSRGLRQRCAIARALIHRPRLILLDEPFTALDTHGIAWLSRLLDDLRSDGCSLCFTTHRMDSLLDLATQQLTLRAGQLADCHCDVSWQEVAA